MVFLTGFWVLLFTVGRLILVLSTMTKIYSKNSLGSYQMRAISLLRSGVPYEKLGLRRQGEADVVNVKCSPLLTGVYRSQPGVLPAYHMNKEHWLSLLLDGTAGDDLIRELLEISFDLTGSKRRPGGGRHEV